MITWKCIHCKNEIVNEAGTYNNRKKSKCPECRADLIELGQKEVYVCNFCNLDSDKDPEKFAEQRIKTEGLIEADLILVASRHLFRMPYSLHEKTALASIVLNPDKILEFQLKDASALKTKIENFYPNPKPGEAKELLIKAIDWNEQKKQRQEMEKQSSQMKKTQEIETHFNDNKVVRKGEFKKIEIARPDESIFPPCIKNILKGIKDDGRKRALYVLMNFFTSLGADYDYIEERIEKWNEKNYNKLKQGYIKSQLIWYKRSGSKMPPNCDKTNYSDLSVCNPDEICRIIKNPVNYAIKKYFKTKK
jgi:hypothetical protein